MAEQHLLPLALTAIGVLVSSNIALVVYIFLNLKGELQSQGRSIETFNNLRFRLIHKDQCDKATEEIKERLDGHDEALEELRVGLATVKTRLDIGGVPCPK